MPASYTPAVDQPRNSSKPRRTPKTWRWPLTILALALLSLWFVGAWGSVAVAWSRGSAGLGPHGLTISISDTPRGEPTGLLTRWHPHHPEWFNAMWWQRNDDLFALGCSLLAPAVLVALAAGVGWYRRARPFNRTGRLSRRRQFRGVRWMATAASAALLIVALTSQWYAIEWLTPYHRVTIDSGTFLWTPDGSASTPWLGKVSLQALGTPVQSEYHILYEWLHLGSRRTLEVSMWLALAVSLAWCGGLWFVRLRRYPFDGECPHCHYDLTGLPAGQPCPECGQVAVERVA